MRNELHELARIFAGVWISKLPLSWMSASAEVGSGFDQITDVAVICDMINDDIKVSLHPWWQRRFFGWGRFAGGGFSNFGL